MEKKIRPGYWESGGKNPFWLNVVDDQVFWLGMNQANKDQRQGANWCHVGCGKIHDDTLELTWSDIPAGRDQLHGRIVIKIIDATHMAVVEDSGGFGRSEWHWVDAVRNFTQ